MPALSQFDRAAAEAFLLGRINYERDGVPYRERSFGLGRMEALVARLGDPHLAAPAVHVAGTKGKGSTSAMIAAILTAAGYRTGLYTSPHFERIEERMSVDGEICPPEEFAELVRRIQPHVETLDAAEGPADGPTYFDITTALAFLFFAQREVDVMVLEVGLGGRLDSTNVCRPAVTAITSISFDHTKQLGTTLAAIAGEKAGILKARVPAVCGVLAAEPREAIHAIAAEQQVPLWQLGREFDYSYEPAGPSMSYREGTARLDGLSLALVGQHQAANAAVAIAVCRRLTDAGWQIGEGELRAGLASGRCAGRIEVLRRQPTVILDTAHNHASIDALLDTLDESFPGRRTILFACSRDKDYRAMLALLLPRADRLILTRFANSPRAVELDALVAAAADAAEELAASGRRPLAAIEAHESSAAAWQSAAANADPADLICITGSFFLAAELRPLATQRL